MNITVSQAKELRELLRTHGIFEIGVMECRKLLQSTNGNLDAAIEMLRQSGSVKEGTKLTSVTANTGAASMESLQSLDSAIEKLNGDITGLSYLQLNELVKNLRDFPVVKDKIDPEQCALREKLYKIAFFDKNLQAGLRTKQTELQTRQAELQTRQAELQTSLLQQIASGQTTTGATGPAGSNLAQNAAMLGGAAALQKLNQIEENTEDVSEGLGFD